MSQIKNVVIDDLNNETMKSKNILIIGKQGVGKTQLAKVLSQAFNIPVIDAIVCLNDLTNKEGIYVSNAISAEVAQIGLPKGFILIHMS